MLLVVIYAPVAQWIEQLTSNLQAVGSSPAGRASCTPSAIGDNLPLCMIMRHNVITTIPRFGLFLSDLAFY